MRLAPTVAALACLLLVLGGSSAAVPRQSLIAWADRDTVWRANVDGSDVRRLTGGMTADVSPDGTRIAFVRAPLTAPSPLYVMNADGTGIRLVRRLGNTNTGRYAPRVQWAPDSRRLAIQDAGPIALVDTSTGAARTLTQATERLTAEMGGFAPQGCAFAYTVPRR